MAKNKRYSIKKIMTASVWLILGVGVIVLLVAAIRKKDTQSLKKVEISITGVQNHYFIDKKDIKRILKRVHKNSLDNAVMSSLDLVSMEKELQKEKWIKKAELFVDNNHVLQVKVIEREPVARVFTTTGASFYLDSSLMRLPLSTKFSARLPVFTSFPTDVLVLTKGDSILLNDIKELSGFIENDEFWMAQIDQIDITPGRTFELIPKVGNQIIRFGDMNNYKEKFNNLLAFYKHVQVKAGWNRYSVIDVQYKNQVVAVQRDAKEIKADSVRAIQIMKNIIAEAQKKTNDTTNVQLKHENDQININQSRVRDDIPEQNDVPGRTTSREPSKRNEAPVTPAAERRGATASTPSKPVVKKEIKPKTTESPKAVMPARRDDR
ncbi:MAG: hypothetical protein ABIN48_13870 [Ginsengibacter sp.]